MSLPIIFISGPTAIGKSELALNLAKKYNGEIINADSMQVYADLNILTARPSDNDNKIIPHHLYGHIKSSYRYNVEKWCNETMSIINKNNQKNILSIIVGGTGFYIETLLNGIVDIPEISEEYKQKSNKLLLKLGLEKFYRLVYDFDKQSCQKISKNDSQRLKRIWEVYNSTGQSLSKWTENNHKNYFKNDNYLIYLFIPDREEIYKKADSRFLKMIDNGAINEVKRLLLLNLDLSLPVMKAHGVPEISKYLSGSLNLKECIARGQQVTRNYVKRQITWWNASNLNNLTIFKLFPSNLDSESYSFLKKIN